MIEKIHDRIEQLKKDLKEESECAVIDANSLELFFAFIEIADEKVVKNLIISLTPDNDIYVSYKEEDVKYSLHFRDNGLISMVRI